MKPFEYDEKDVMKFPIKEQCVLGCVSYLYLSIFGNPHIYTQAPGIIPRPGYRFVGYEYDDGVVAPDSIRWYPRGVPTFPVFAKYRKLKDRSKE